MLVVSLGLVSLPVTWMQAYESIVPRVAAPTNVQEQVRACTGGGSAGVRVRGVCVCVWMLARGRLCVYVVCEYGNDA